MADTTVDLIYSNYEQTVNSTSQRGYIGWSAIGAKCERAIYYDWRWVSKKHVEGRIARLFETGHREEDRVIENLRKLPNVEVFDSPEGGGQFAVSPMAKGHLRGHLDCVVKNLPEYPGEAVLVDVKTANTKRFDRVVANGMAVESPQYVAQATGYMGLMNLKRAAYLYVCKDDDRLHIEWLEFDQALFDQLVAKAERIIATDRPPMRFDDDPKNFTCRYCDHKAICQEESVAAQVNCRTCKSGEPVENGAWRCTLTDSEIPLNKQRIGCDEHLYLTPMVPFANPMTGEYGPDYQLYDHHDAGGFFLNRRASHPQGFQHYTSKEIAAVPNTLLIDEELQGLRWAFAGELVAGAECPPELEALHPNFDGELVDAEG